MQANMVHALNNWAHDTSSYDVGPLYQCRLAMGNLSIMRLRTYCSLDLARIGVYLITAPMKKNSFSRQ